jgi:hypothetical protein
MMVVDDVADRVEPVRHIEGLVLSPLREAVLTTGTR